MNNDLNDELQALVDEGKSQDEILYFLFSKGLIITEAIVAMRTLYRIKLDKAKEIVSSSPYWENTHKRNQGLHEILKKVAEGYESFVEFNQESMSSIKVIAPYKYLEMWVFDDDRVGLAKEPFVGGSDAMIDRIVADIPDAERGFLMLFSDFPFPNYVVKLEWRKTDSAGNWYYSEKLNMEGWLCPALLKYFRDAPKEIFVQVKSKTE